MEWLAQTGPGQNYCTVTCRRAVSGPSRLHRARPESIVAPDWIATVIMMGAYTYSPRSNGSDSLGLFSDSVRLVWRDFNVPKGWNGVFCFDFLCYRCSPTGSHFGCWWL